MLLSVGNFAIPVERRNVIKLIKREPTGTISVLNPPVGASAIDGSFLLWFLGNLSPSSLGIFACLASA